MNQIRRLTASSAGVRVLVVGAWCSTSSSGGGLSVPATARQVYDVTGAGDTRIAVLATCVAAGEALDTPRWRWRITPPD